jgi:hypothetical protein
MRNRPQLFSVIDAFECEGLFLARRICLNHLKQLFRKAVLGGSPLARVIVSKGKLKSGAQLRSTRLRQPNTGSEELYGNCNKQSVVAFDACARRERARCEALSQFVCRSSLRRPCRLCPCRLILPRLIYLAPSPSQRLHHQLPRYNTNTPPQTSPAIQCNDQRPP